MSFQNLEQRLAQAYIKTFPDFKPAENGCSVKEQETFYNLIRSLYQLACDEPDLFVNTLHEDDYYIGRFNKTTEAKPDLYKNMKAFTKSIDDLLESMFQMGNDKDAVKLNRRQMVILKRLGIDDGGALPAFCTWILSRQASKARWIFFLTLKTTWA